MEHLTNCHGEWSVLFAMATSLPLMGTYIKYKLGGKYECNE